MMNMQQNITTGTPTDMFRVPNQEIIEAADKWSGLFPEESPTDAFKSGAAWMWYRLAGVVGRDKFESGAYRTGNLTLDDAIKHCEDMEQIMETEEVREEHRLLKGWLIELRNRREQTSQQKT